VSLFLKKEISVP